VGFDADTLRKVYVYDVYPFWKPCGGLNMDEIYYPYRKIVDPPRGVGIMLDIGPVAQFGRASDS
jgi:hypothetical protein